MQKLELTEVSSGYGRNEVIHRINLKITESSIYVVLGPNGAGKTTLFRRINGILKPFSGIVKFDDEDLFYSKECPKKMSLRTSKTIKNLQLQVFSKGTYFFEDSASGAQPKSLFFDVKPALKS
jgi:branched-chain amino acid transport system ATP-binding protein